MHTLKIANVILICEIINALSEHWYSADKREEIADQNSGNDPFNHEQPHTAESPGYSTGEHKLLQMNPIRPNKTNVIPTKYKTSHFIETSTFTLGQDIHDPIRNSSPLKSIDVIKYNNTINLINIIKRVKPKKKIFKRRCPNQRIQHSKRLTSNQSAGRTKFLEVFEVVEFKNVACTSSSGLEGTCLHEYECESNGGSTMGTCADGYGTCCVTQFLCDGQSSETLGWFSNPGFPSPSTERLSCTFTLNKASEDIKQIRLDFIAFELLAPNAGTCQKDQFVVSGQNMNSVIPILCGINTGQHAYIEVGDIEGPIYLSVQTDSSESRMYSIKVTQLTATDVLSAPTGCLQYFQEEQGILESFNYRDRSEIGIPRVPSYLNNLNYAMCIRRAPETCSVTYVNADYMRIVNYDLDGLPVIPQGQAGVEIFNCPGDWLLIAATRLCGDKLNDGAVLQDFSLDAPVTDSNAGPITVWFRSDEGYTGRGFKIQYQQNACNGPS